jgi:streptomycin 6-kinase
VTNGSITTNQLDRIQQHARNWRLSIEESFETETSVISFGTRDAQSLVLKVVKHEGDEWLAGEVISAFDGHGVVRVYEHTAGAMLLECARPGNSLADMALNGSDAEATEILAGVIEKMSARVMPLGCPTVEAWAKAFARYLATGQQQIPSRLVKSGQRVFEDLCGSQSRRRLLHGDLHHDNVLFDSERGWLVIDPKGVVGEIEYEVGAILRNPFASPEVFLAPSTIERRLEQLTNRLNLDYEPTLAWSFAQAVLSAIWLVEDGYEVDATNSSLRLAEIIQPMLGGR